MQLSRRSALPSSASLLVIFHYENIIFQFLFADKTRRQWYTPVDEGEFEYILKDEVVHRLNELGRVSTCSFPFLACRLIMACVKFRLASVYQTIGTESHRLAVGSLWVLKLTGRA